MGFDLIHYNPWQNLFKACEIDLIVDAGANIGQTYEKFRLAGFTGPICSFEPAPETFRRLQAQPGHDWERVPCALSNRSGQAAFNITDNDNANSLHKATAGVIPNVLRSIDVPVFRLDELWGKHGLNGKHVFLKIDTEGHDLEVVKGASGVLDFIPLIMMEVSLTPRYDGEPDLRGIVNAMDELGYSACRMEKNSPDFSTGMDAALDVVFAKKSWSVKEQTRRT